MGSQKRSHEDAFDLYSATSPYSPKRRTTSTGTPQRNLQHDVPGSAIFTFPAPTNSWPKVRYDDGLMTKNQKKFLQDTLRCMKQTKAGRQFMRERAVLSGEPLLVNDPGYKSVIKRHIDLDVISEGIKNDVYLAVDYVVDDIELLISNAFLYWGAGHENFDKAMSLRQYFFDKMQSCPQSLSGTPEPESIASNTVVPKRTSILPETSRKKKAKSKKHRKDKGVDDTGDELEKVDEAEIERLETIIVSATPLITAEKQKANKQLTGRPRDRSEQAENPDIETRQLQMEIEERQQKLASIVRKKELSEELENLDDRKAELKDKLKETEKQYQLVKADLQEHKKAAKAHEFEGIALRRDQAWQQEERERLDRENERIRRDIEINRQFEDELIPKAHEYDAKSRELNSARDELEEKDDQVTHNYHQLTESYKQLKEQRFVAQKNLDDLNNTNT